MTYPRYLPDGGRQVPEPYDSDPDVPSYSQHRPHEPRDVMAQLIVDHQIERDRQHELSSSDGGDQAGDRQSAGWLRRLVRRRRR